MPERSCEVCGGPINHRTRHGVCARCRSAGAAFSRAWADALVARGMTGRQVADVLGVAQETVEARHRERGYHVRSAVA
jgi:hypothetical protein